ncbi:hypothetical protein ACFPN0_03570 [Kitasatospora cinereorecta]
MSDSHGSGHCDFAARSCSTKPSIRASRITVALLVKSSYSLIRSAWMPKTSIVSGRRGSLRGTGAGAAGVRSGSRERSRATGSITRQCGASRAAVSSGASASGTRAASL